MNNIFLKYSIPDLQKILKKKEISFLDISIEVSRNINNYEDMVHAWVCLDLDRLESILKSYDQIEHDYRKSKLIGMPYGIKDIFNTKYFPTQMGSAIWKNFYPGNNARIVDCLNEQCAIDVGKTVTAEFAVHSLNETRNPHHLLKTPGTSSSGSAAAVSLGMVPFALGTQTAGSIIRPASFCGVWGMKPSFGLIPRTGVLKTTDSLDTIGFLASHGKSLRSILDGVRVRGPNYPFVYNNIDNCVRKSTDVDQPWKVGLLKTHVWNDAKSYVKDSVISLAMKINQSKNFVVSELEWPEQFSECHDIHSIIYEKSLSYYFEKEKEFYSDISPIMADMIERGTRIQKNQYLQALNFQNEYQKKINILLADYDLVLTIGTSSSAPNRNESEIVDPSLLWTMAHIPSVAVPAGICPDNLPFAVQFISKKWNDYTLLFAIEDLIDNKIIRSDSEKINMRNSNMCVHLPC